MKKYEFIERLEKLFLIIIVTSLKNNYSFTINDKNLKIRVFKYGCII